MTQTQYGLKVKDFPAIKRIILAAFPSYKKHGFSLGPFHRTNVSTYWDGGSRSQFAIVNLDTGARLALPSSSHPYFDVAARGMADQATDVIETDRVGNLYLKVLPAGFALVECGTFCGKPATAHVLIGADDLGRYLPAAPAARALTTGDTL